MKYWGFILVFVTVCFSVRAQKPGTLDSSFAENGKLYAPIKYYNTCEAVLVQKDGKIIQAGQGGYDAVGGFSMVRYLYNSQIDSSFGVDGWVVTDLGESDVINALAEQPDRKIIAAGTLPIEGKIAVARYKINGTLDSSFGLNGVTITDVDNGKEYLEDMALLADGKIVVTGYLRRNENDIERSFTARFLPDGTLDQSFGESGIVIHVFDEPTEIHAVAVQTDGKILIGGGYGFGSSADFVVLRYLANGTVDNSFGTDGIALAGFANKVSSSELRSLVIQRDGKIIGGGFAGAMALARFDSDGSLDENFGETGRVIVSAGSDGGSEINDVLLQPDGKIIGAGRYSNFSTFSYFALARFSNAGHLDSSFAINGIQTTVFTGLTGAEAAALQEDGKIILGGDSYDIESDGNHFILIRYNGDKSRIWYVRIKRWLERHGFVWEGSPESNVRYYAVQRSSNGSAFTEIARIFNRKGGTQQYQYEDASSSSLSSDSYYRIEAVSDDGSTTSSNVLQILANASAIKVFPNPAKNTVTVQGLPENKKTKLVITNINGNTLLSVVANNNYQWNISQLKQGHYVLKAKINNQLISAKFVKE